MIDSNLVLPGLKIFEPDIYEDRRGLFLELWNQMHFQQEDLHASFVQDNLSISKKGVLRGLHYQHPKGQGKLVTVLDGAVFDVVADIRKSSASYGKWFGTELTSANRRQLYIPRGMAHGFVVLSESASFYYKCTEHYAPEHEHSIRWDDPELDIDWPVDDPILSDKDRSAPALVNLPREALPD